MKPSKIDEPLLTLGDVQKWEARKMQLAEVIRGAQDELSQLEIKLGAAKVFVGERPDQKAPEIVISKASRAKDERISTAILRTLSVYPDGAAPREIQGSLEADGFDMSRLSANPGYFYTVLGRLKARKLIEKRRNGNWRLLPKQESSQEETGAVGAPARQ